MEFLLEALKLKLLQNLDSPFVKQRIEKMKKNFTFRPSS